MKQTIYACYALSDTEKELLLEAYRREQLVLLTETAEGKMLLRGFAQELLERASALSEEQMKMLKSRLGEPGDQPAAFQAMLSELFEGLAESGTEAEKTPEPKLKTSPKRKIAPVVKLLPSKADAEKPKKPETAETEAKSGKPVKAEAVKPAGPEKKPAAGRKDMPEPVVWRWEPPKAELTEETKPAKKSGKPEETNLLLRRRMQTALDNCRKIVILPMLLTKPQKGSRFLSRGHDGGANGIAYIDREGRLSCLNAVPALEAALQTWESLEGIRAFEEDAMLFGIRRDGSVYPAGVPAGGKVSPETPYVAADELISMAFPHSALRYYVLCGERMKKIYESGGSVLDYCAGKSFYVILCRDGSVLLGGGGMEQKLVFDRPVAAVAAGEDCAYLLHENGRVHVVSSAEDAEPVLLPWERILAVQAAGGLVCGLQTNGRLVSNQPEFSMRLSGWTNIAAFALRGAKKLKKPQILAVSSDGMVMCSESLGIPGRKIESGIIPIP